MLIGKRETSGQAEQVTSLGLFTDVARAQAARKQALVDLFIGRTQAQQRGADGRYASGGYDGGARADGDPPRERESHGQWLGRVLRERRADVGGAGF